MREKPSTHLQTPLMHPLEPRLFLAAGTLDPSFAHRGIALLAGSDGNTDNISVARQQDGKLLVLAGPRPNFQYTTLTRYNSDGSRDRAFATDGRIVFDPAKVVAGNCLAVQNDGMILAATESGAQDGTLFRYTPRGEPDKTFGSNGVAATAPHRISAITFAPNRIILTRSIDGFQVERYFNSGKLDKTFAGGVVFTHFKNVPGYEGYCRAVTVQNDGKIIAAGHINFHLALVRYTWNGKLDTIFSRPSPIAIARRVFPLPDGKTLAAGWHVGDESQYILARYLPNGALDKRYGVRGYVLTHIGGDTIGHLADSQYIDRLPDGKVIIVGGEKLQGPGPSQDIVIARFNPDGSPDTTFGLNGSTQTDFLGLDTPRGVFATADGNIQVVVRSVRTRKSLLISARYKAD